jgi:hypothetical protein
MQVYLRWAEQSCCYSTWLNCSATARPSYSASSWLFRILALLQLLYTSASWPHEDELLQLFYTSVSGPHEDGSCCSCCILRHRDHTKMEAAAAVVYVGIVTTWRWKLRQLLLTSASSSLKYGSRCRCCNLQHLTNGSYSSYCKLRQLGHLWMEAAACMYCTVLSLNFTSILAEI